MKKSEIKISDIAADVAANLSQEEKDYIFEHTKSAEDMINFHFSLGMQVRNTYNLWHRNDRPKDKCADDLSGEILEDVWKILNK